MPASQTGVRRFQFSQHFLKESRHGLCGLLKCGVLKHFLPATTGIPLFPLMRKDVLRGNASACKNRMVKESRGSSD